MAFRPLLVLPLICAALFGASAAIATAQEDDGVFVDPNSPAGKEYAIPEERARRDAGVPAPRRGPAQGAGQADEDALFGAGIGPGGGSAKPSSGEGPAAQGSADPGTAEQGGAPLRPSRPEDATADPAGAAWTWLGGSLAVVVGLAALGTALLRRGGRDLAPGSG